MMTIVRDLARPWNEWKPCLKSKCPFYGQTGVRRSDKSSLLVPKYGCTRPDKEMKK